MRFICLHSFRGRPRIEVAGHPRLTDPIAAVGGALIHGTAVSAHRMGGAKRYPSIASYGDDGFRGLNPSYALRTKIGRDHPIDACACAVAGRDGASRLGGDEVDISGLQMQINC